MTSPSTDGGTRGQILSWALFDFANTAFYVTILTVGFPLYFREVVVGGGPFADFLWGLAFSISMAVVAIFSPILGAVADAGTGKKGFLAVFTLLCIAATASLFTVGPGMVVAGMALLILANIGFEAGLVFYDAFLPEIASERTVGRISGYGFAAGYAGSLIMLAVAFPLYVGGFAEGNLRNVQFSFVLAAGIFFVFALPLFFVLPDRQRVHKLDRAILRSGFTRLAGTFRSLSSYRNIAWFLAAYFLYADGINTIIVFSSIFARETLQFDIGEIILFFAVIQTSALIGSIVFGILADHIGHKQTLTITLLLWLGLTGAAYLVTTKAAFTVVGALAGIALGSSQSTSRSLMSRIIPADKKTEFFGFYSFFGKASAILGPLVFGIVSSNIDQRTAILSVGVFLLAGLLLLRRVHVPPLPSS
ncbi:MAG: MFS transporter [Bacteroidota bacterium]